MQDIDFSIKSRPQLVANTTNLFDVHVTVHRVKFLAIKPTRCTNF